MKHDWHEKIIVWPGVGPVDSWECARCKVFISADAHQHIKDGECHPQNVQFFQGFPVQYTDNLGPPIDTDWINPTEPTEPPEGWLDE